MSVSDERICGFCKWRDQEDDHCRNLLSPKAKQVIDVDETCGFWASTYS
jgi:hypothetical protein